MLALSVWPFWCFLVGDYWLALFWRFIVGSFWLALFGAFWLALFGAFWLALFGTSRWALFVLADKVLGITRKYKKLPENIRKDQNITEIPEST